MKNLKLATLTAVALSLTAGSAHAQAKYPVTLKLGIFLPQNSSAREFGNSGQISGGVEFALNGTEQTTGFLYVDGQGAKHNGGHVYGYAAGVGVRQYGESFSRGVMPYGGAGLGYYMSDVSANTSQRKGGLGGKLFGGLDFGHNVLAEINYQWFPSASGVSPSGFGAQVGLRL
jgi:hypothetical protein